MDSFAPLSPVQQTAAPAPVAAIDIRPLPPVSAPVAPTGALPANDDVIELSSAARLLSAASAVQDINPAQGNGSNFAGVLGAALNFVSAFNSLNGNLDAAGNPVAGAANIANIANITNTPGILDTTPATGANLLLQAFSTTPLDSAAAGGNSDRASLLTGLANIGIALQGPLPANAAATLTISQQLLQDAFNGNPAGTSAILAQASLVFAPLAASLIAQDNAPFLTAQDVAAATNSQDALPAQLDPAAGNPAIPAAVADANAALQRTLADEALREAIAAAEAGSLPAPIATANRDNAGTAAATRPAGALNNSGTALAAQNTAAGNPAASASDTSGGIVGTAAGNGEQAGNAIAGAIAGDATTQNTANTANTVSPQNAAASASASGLAQTVDATADTIADITADTTSTALPAAANATASQAGDAAPANAAPVSSAAAATASATDTTAGLDQQPIVALPIASADTLATGTVAPAAAASSTTPAATGNPNTITSIDPALAAALAAYNLRVPFTTVMDDRGAREVASQINEAVNSVESVSAISPVKMNVHDEVAAAQRNAMLRNDTAPKA